MTATPMPPFIILAVVAIGIAYTLFSVFLQRKLVDPKRMREIQFKVNQLSKEMNAMIKSNAPKEEISSKQKELYPLMSENMRKQFKPMIVILPIFLLVYDVLLKMAFGTYSKDIVQFIFPMNYQNLFFATVLILGLIISMVILVYDRKKAKKEQEQNQSQNQNTGQGTAQNIYK